MSGKMHKNGVQASNREEINKQINKEPILLVWSGNIT
jgi:hypothetical protein